MWTRVREVLGPERPAAPPPNPWPAAGRNITYDDTSPGVTPEHPDVQRIIHASSGDLVGLHVTDAVNRIEGHPGNWYAYLGDVDLLTAKELAIVALHEEMILPASGDRGRGIVAGEPDRFVGDRRTKVMASTVDSGFVHLNMHFFGEGRRNTLLGALQSSHDWRTLLGGGHYGSAPVILHEKMHTLADDDPEWPAAEDENRTGKPAFKSAGPAEHPDAVNSLDALSGEPGPAAGRTPAQDRRPDRADLPEHLVNTPHHFAPLGGYAELRVRERWAEAGRLVLGYGSLAPREAKRGWESVVPMDAARWAAVDRQAANLYRTLDVLYAETDPATGRQLFSPEDRARRVAAMTASRGFLPVWAPGRRSSQLDPVTHGVNALDQAQRDAMPVLPTWAGLGQPGGVARELDII